MQSQTTIAQHQYKTSVQHPFQLISRPKVTRAKELFQTVTECFVYVFPPEILGSYQTLTPPEILGSYQTLTLTQTKYKAGKTWLKKTATATTATPTGTTATAKPTITTKGDG